FRVVRPGGELRFYEHVRAHNPALAVAQRAIDPFWSRLGGGCHLTRQTEPAIAAAGFVIEHIERFEFAPCALDRLGAWHARARARLEDEGAYIELAELFGALADATRAKIVHTLMHQELCTCDIAAVVGVSESGVSQHLRVLRSLRLVKSRRAGKFVYYSLDDAHVALLIQVGLAHQGHEDATLTPGDLLSALGG